MESGGTGATPFLRLKPGVTFGRYRLVQTIGSGASSVVFEATHQSLGRRVAVKVLRALPGEGRAAKVAAERFLREGRAAARVRHPHIVDVFDLGVEEGFPYLAMELVEGETLAQLLQRRTKLPLQVAVDILLPILSAVAELHAAGIVHRDIKPANILLASYGGMHPKLTDFGISRVDDGSPSLTHSGAILGTPGYMAPELLNSQEQATEFSDQYALGVVLYECTTGEKPFRGVTTYDLMHAIVSGTLRPPSELDNLLPQGFDAVVLRALERDRGRRYAAVDELAEELLPFASESARARWRGDFMAPRSAPSSPDTNARSAFSSRAGGGAANRRVGVRVWAAAAVAIAAASAGAVALGRGARSAPSMTPPPAASPAVVALEVPAATEPSADAPGAPSAAASPVEAPTKAGRGAAPSPALRSGSSAALHGTTDALDASASRPARALERGGNGAPILDVP